MQVTKKEVYESKSLSEVVSKAESSARQQISDAQASLPTQEIADSKNQIKGAVDFANTKKFDGQLQANLLKDRLLDVNREGNLEGLEKEAKKAKVEDLGVIKDNLGKDIARHEGPGIDDMYKKSKKYEMPDRDPLKGLPKTEKQEKDAKKAPDMPLKDDPKLASEGSAYDDLKKMLCGFFDKCPPEPKAPARKEIEKIKDNLGANKPDGGTPKLKEYEPPKTKKYVDPDQVDATNVEKPKEPPPNAKDLLGHKVNPLNNDPIIDMENIDIKKVAEENKKVPQKTLIYTDPDQKQEEPKFDPANPPQLPGSELKNTGNPIDNAELPRQKAPTAEPEGGQPHTDGTETSGSIGKIPLNNEEGSPLPIGGSKN